MRSFRHCWLVITGRIPVQYSTERMEFDMALEKFTAAVADLKTAADALIAKSGSDASAAASAQSELANVDVNAAAAIQPITDSINAVLNPAPSGGSGEQPQS